MDPPSSDYYRKREELDEARVAHSPRDYPPHGEDSGNWEDDEEPRDKEDASLPPEETNSKKRHRRDSRDPVDEEDQRRQRSSPRGSAADDDEMVSASLLVRHLKFSTAPHVVRKFFEQCGEVKDVYLPLEYETGRPRGFGFVEFVHSRDAQEALRTLNDTELEGARISISVAQHGRKTPSIMRTRSSGYRRSGGGRGGSRREPYSAPDRYNDRYDRGDSPPMRERSHRYDDGGYRGREYRDRDRDRDGERDHGDREYGRDRSYRDGGRDHGGSSSREDGYKSYGRRRY